MVSFRFGTNYSAKVIALKSASARIRLARRAAALTQADLARQMKVSRSAVAQWERSDGSNPTSANLERLAIALACSFEWLATGRGNKSTQSKHSSGTADAAVHLRHFAKDDAEDQLLAAFRELEHWDQKAVLSVVDTFTHRPRRTGLKPKKR